MTSTSAHITRDRDGDSPHTPGPWRLVSEPYEDDGTPYFIFNAGIECYDPNGGPGFRFTAICSEADARLISAAPEMLTALKEMDQLFEFAAEAFECACFPPGKQEHLNAAFKLAAAAIAKAEGRER